MATPSIALDRDPEKVQPSFLRLCDAPSTNKFFYRPLSSQHIGPRKVFIALERRFREIHDKLHGRCCWARLPGDSTGLAKAFTLASTQRLLFLFLAANMTDSTVIVPLSDSAPTTALATPHGTCQHPSTVIGGPPQALPADNPLQPTGHPCTHQHSTVSDSEGSKDCGAGASETSQDPEQPRKRRQCNGQSDASREDRPTFRAAAREVAAERRRARAARQLRCEKELRDHLAEHEHLRPTAAPSGQDAGASADPAGHKGVLLRHSGAVTTMTDMQRPTDISTDNRAPMALPREPEPPPSSTQHAAASAALNMPHQPVEASAAISKHAGTAPGQGTSMAAHRSVPSPGRAVPAAEPTHNTPPDTGRPQSGVLTQDSVRTYYDTSQARLAGLAGRQYKVSYAHRLSTGFPSILDLRYLASPKWSEKMEGRAQSISKIAALMKQRDVMKQAALGSSLTQPAGQRIRPDAKSIDESAFKVLLGPSSWMIRTKPKSARRDLAELDALDPLTQQQIAHAHGLVSGEQIMCVAKLKAPSQQAACWGCPDPACKSTLEGPPSVILSHLRREDHCSIKRLTQVMFAVCQIHTATNERFIYVCEKFGIVGKHEMDYVGLAWRSELSLQQASKAALDTQQRPSCGQASQRAGLHGPNHQAAGKEVKACREALASEDGQQPPLASHVHIQSTATGAVGVQSPSAQATSQPLPEPAGSPGNVSPDQAVEASLDAASRQGALVHEVSRTIPITKRSIDRIPAGASSRMAVAPITKQEPDSPLQKSLAAAEKPATGSPGEGSGIDHEADGIIDLTSDGEEESDTGRARADGDASKDPVGCAEQPMLPSPQGQAGNPPSQQGTAAQQGTQPLATDLRVGGSDRQQHSQQLTGQALVNKAFQYQRTVQATRGIQQDQLEAPSGPVPSQAAEPLAHKLLDAQVTTEDLTCKESPLQALQDLPAPPSGSSGRDYRGHDYGVGMTKASDQSRLHAIYG
ncbi:hypothetical protein WJX84_011804 [Apatococcus fuscideae]|uniref:Uncharacterized protein n=1 Tax=Apatococcus fuscideae TaxID=2026836 RepID=A0AAW1TEH9_9CHLO